LKGDGRRVCRELRRRNGGSTARGEKRSQRRELEVVLRRAGKDDRVKRGKRRGKKEEREDVPILSPSHNRQIQLPSHSPPATPPTTPRTTPSNSSSCSSRARSSATARTLPGRRPGSTTRRRSRGQRRRRVRECANGRCAARGWGTGRDASCVVVGDESRAEREGGWRRHSEVDLRLVDVSS
jgi:hypothetical protein